MSALEWAAQQAQLLGATLVVLAAWEWPVNYGWTLPFPSDFDPRREAQDMVRRAVAPLAAAHPGVPVETMVVEGHPAPALVAASGQADLLVVGSRGHGGLAGLLLGSVSEHCVTNAHCPVMVVRQDGTGSQG